MGGGFLSVTDARRHVPAVATTGTGDVRGDPEVLAKGRHCEDGVERLVDLKARRRGAVAQLDLSLFKRTNENSTQLRKGNWSLSPVG